MVSLNQWPSWLICSYRKDFHGNKGRLILPAASEQKTPTSAGSHSKSLSAQHKSPVSWSVSTALELGRPPAGSWVGLLPHWVSPQGWQDHLPRGGFGTTAAVRGGRLDLTDDLHAPSVSDAGWLSLLSSLWLGYQSPRHSWSQFWVKLKRR